MNSDDLITVNPDILGGTPVFKGTRVPVKTLFEYLENNYSLEEFLECFPSVTRDLACRVLERSENALLSSSVKILLEPISQIGNGRVARDLALRQGTRRENTLHGSLTDEQRRRSGKDPATLRAKFWPAAGGVASQSQSAATMLLRRVLPAARLTLAHSFTIYEMGS